MKHCLALTPSFSPALFLTRQIIMKEKWALYNVQGVTGEPSFMHSPSPIAIPWSLYFINICFLSLIIYRVHRAAANDKNRTETTSSKLVDFICSLTRKFKAESSIWPESLALYVLTYYIQTFFAWPERCSLANQPCTWQLPILKKKRPENSHFPLSNLMEGNVITLIGSKHWCYLWISEYIKIKQLRGAWMSNSVG